MDKPFKVGDWVLFKKVDMYDVVVIAPMEPEQANGVHPNYLEGSARIDRHDNKDMKDISKNSYMVSTYSKSEKTLYTFGGQLHSNLELDKNSSISGHIHDDIKDWLKDNKNG